MTAAEDGHDTVDEQVVQITQCKSEAYISVWSGRASLSSSAEPAHWYADTAAASTWTIVVGRWGPSTGDLGPLLRAENGSAGGRRPLENDDSRRDRRRTDVLNRGPATAAAAVAAAASCADGRHDMPPPPCK